jgi:hypothetical protein
MVPGLGASAKAGNLSEMHLLRSPDLLSQKLWGGAQHSAGTENPWRMQVRAGLTGLSTALLGGLKTALQQVHISAEWRFVCGGCFLVTFVRNDSGLAQRKV